VELFEQKRKERVRSGSPLAHRMRPGNLGEFVGQEHILGPGKLLRKAIEADRISSLILYGPPGCGKTALTLCIAHTTKAHFSRLNAVTSGVTEIRQVTEEARDRRRVVGMRTILFIDEIHRFNKAQQDALMPDVEDGNIILIGATVHNPYFSINSPLLSRSLIFTLNPLSGENIRAILSRALKDKERGLGKYRVSMGEDALRHLVKVSDGDARRALNALELGVLTTKPGGKKGIVHFDLSVAEESIRKKVILYDRNGDSHYDTVSAFIKSMRGSDPDAALYWMAKMLQGGEDPRFVARRIVICAAEDVGNADPMALVVANAALNAAEFVGMPEARIPLAQAVTYIATAPKSNAAYLAISAAMKDVREKKAVPVPVHLRGTGYPGAEKLGHGKGYKYPHEYEGHFVEQEYAPGVGKKYYEPSGIGFEKEILERLREWEKRRKASERALPRGSGGQKASPKERAASQARLSGGEGHPREK
jgi:putative ATPase